MTREQLEAYKKMMDERLAYYEALMKRLAARQPQPPKEAK